MGQPPCHLRIPLPKHFDFGECLWFLDRNQDDCLYRVDRHSVQRALRLRDQKVMLAVRHKGRHLEVHYRAEKSDGALDAAVRAYVSQWFDLDRDLTGFYALLDQDRQLGYMVQEYGGLRMIGIPDLFEGLCWCIIGQQINLTFAHKMKRALVTRYGEVMQVGSHQGLIFPTPERLGDASMEDLKGLQFSRQKADYILHMAKLFAEGALSKAQLMAVPSRQERLQRLLDIRGIGPWTANYVLMKCLQDPACIPIKDTGLLTALQRHDIISDRHDQRAMDRFFQKYAGWQSYLVIYLWRSLSHRPT